MASKIKGITIEINASTTEFNKALKKMYTQVQDVEKELKYLDKALELDPKNTELLAQKQELLAKKVELTKDKVENLKRAKAEADQILAKGEKVNEEHYRRLVRELATAEKQLESLTSKSKKFTESCKKTGDKISDIGKKGMVATTAIVGGVVAASETTREYREDLNRLNTAFETNGKTAEMAREVYEGFYKVLGEEDRSVEAVNHLAKLCTTQEELAEWTDICAGVSATFGDSLPIEGLTEAANETAKVGKVTGPLADALNWAGIMEDDFNKKLEACSSEQERSALITNTLSQTYDKAAESFKKNNAEVMKNREASLKLKDAIAKLGGIAEPIITRLLGVIGKLVDKFMTMSSNGQKAVLVVMAVTAVIPPLLIVIGNLITAVGILNKTMLANPASKVILLMSVLTMGIVALGAAATSQASEVEKLNEECKQQYENYKKLKQASEEKIKKGIDEINQTEQLKNELVALVDANGKVEDANKSRVQFILGELNRALGTEYSMTGNVINGYKELSASIDDLIIKKKAEILLQGKEETYRTARENITDAKRNVDNLKEAYEDAIKAYKDYVKWYNENTKTVGTGIQLKALKNEAEQIEEELNKAAHTYGIYVADIQDYEKTATSILEDGGKKVVAEWEKRAGLAEIKGKETMEKYNDGIESVDTATPASNKADEAINAMSAEVAAKKAELSAIGNSIVEGLASGITAFNPMLQSRIKQMTDQIPKNFNQNLKINSPAKVMIPTGEAIPEGIAKGMKQKTNEVLKTVQEQAKAITEEYNNYIKAFVDYASIGLSQYNIWKYQNGGANELTAKKKNVEYLQGDVSSQQAITDRAKQYMDTNISRFGKDSKEAREATVEYYKQLEKLEKILSQINTLQNEIAILEDTNRYSQNKYDNAKAKYDLWEAEHTEATESEKLEKQKEMLTEQYDEQGKKVQEVNDKLYTEIQLSGENSEASRALILQLNKEKTAYIQLGNAIKDVNAEKSKVSYDSRQSYGKYMVQYGALLKQQGISQADIDKAARKVSGYTGEKSIVIQNNNYGVTKETAYEVVRRTEKTANELAMQGVL